MGNVLATHMKTINISCSYIPTDQQELSGSLWLRQFPDGKPVWQDWRFIFNAVAEDYDYLVVLRNLPAPTQLRCPPENTIHVTLEPPSIKNYENNFLAQFGAVITQDIQTQHPCTILNQSGLLWLLGIDIKTPDGGTRAFDFAELKQLFDQAKTKLLSVISSDKADTEGHLKRLEFVQKLKQHFGNKVDLYGHGLLEMRDKMEALQDYRFHVVLENSNFDHYFSEKLVDCMLAGSYPIYHGCPNLGSYFPDNSYTHIDINNPDTAIETIKLVTTGDYDIKYREQLRQARDMALYEYNLYPMLIKIITEMEQGKHGNAAPTVQPSEYMLPYNHTDMRPIGRTLLIKMRRFNVFRSIRLMLKGAYLKHWCRKLQAKQRNTNI